MKIKAKYCNKTVTIDTDLTAPLKFVKDEIRLLFHVKLVLFTAVVGVAGQGETRLRI